MKTLMTTTALLATMSTAAFAGPVGTAICAGHSHPADCEAAIELLEGNFELYQEMNRTIYNAGYASLNDLIESAETPVEVIVEVEVPTTETVIVEVDAAPGQLVTAFANGKAEGKAEGYEIGLAAGAAEAESFGFDAGYVAGIDASQDLVDEARADLAAVEAGVDAAVAAGIAAIDVDAIAHGARKEALNAISEVIADHNPRDAKTFRNDPLALIDGVYNYLWNLRGQLGLSGKP